MALGQTVDITSMHVCTFFSFPLQLQYIIGKGIIHLHSFSFHDPRQTYCTCISSIAKPTNTNVTELDTTRNEKKFSVPNYQTLKDSWEESCVLQGVSAKEWVITSTVKRPFSGTCSTRQPGPSTNQKPSLNNSVNKILTSVLRFSQTE